MASLSVRVKFHPAVHCTSFHCVVGRHGIGFTETLGPDALWRYPLLDEIIAHGIGTGF
jgi:hypothetical protein